MANHLGNTPAVCRASYINPLLFELFDEGVTIEAALPDLGAHGRSGPPATKGPVEEAVLRLLSIRRLSLLGQVSCRLRVPPTAAGKHGER
ncbi:hypothetical protein [Streptomyces cyaneofuscatus]|uniref:hypothetical protein n=1 Tax=Streptomyces cyaneofuscatus TaxID=66883 RepID=UPI0038188743